MAGIEGSKTPIPQPVSLFVIRLSTTMKSQRLYPTGSDIPRRNAQDALEALRQAIGPDEPHLELMVARDGLRYGETGLFPRSESFVQFAREFYKRNLAAVRFLRTTTAEEINQFLSLIIEPAEDLAARGGVESGLSEMGVTNINVSEASTRIVETTVGQAQEEELDEESQLTIEEIFANPAYDQKRDMQVLLRVMGDRTKVAEYLKSAMEQGTVEGARMLAHHIDALLRGIRTAPATERDAALEAVAEALLQFDLKQRGALYKDHLLASTRYDEETAALLGKLGRDEVLDALIAQFEESGEGIEGLAKAIRQLANMSSDAGGLDLNLVLSEMAAKGMGESFIHGLTEALNPKRITGIEQLKTGAATSAGVVLDMAGVRTDGSRSLVDEQALEPLRTEAAVGTTDGDIVGALVLVATLEARSEQFNAVMTHVEDSVGFLVEAGETDVAADVAEVLARAMADPSTPDANRQRMAHVIGSIARPESLAKVASTLRRHRTDSAEYAACERLLGVLGESALDPLLEILAEEQDMAARKSLIDLISISAASYIPELGQRLADKRWYLVRNVVSILASTKAPEALPHLQRTLRHSDARVRRETIRGLASIRTVMSDSMIAAGLEDEDVQNVQLAARYLGSFRAKDAAPRLEQVAQGYGHGSRDMAARLEAISALAKIGAPTSGAVLRELAQKRGLFGGGRDRDVREAAVEALQAYEATVSGQGVA